MTPETGDGRPGWSLAAASTVTGVFVLSNAPTPLYVRWQAEWGFSSGTLTVVFAAYMVGLIATLLTAGTLADHYGRKAVLIPGLGAAVASSALFLLAGNVLWLLVARLLAGVAVGAAVTAGMAATVDLAGRRRGRTGSLIASAAMVFGAGLGPLLSGIIAQTSNAPQRPVFTIVLALTLLALIVAVCLPIGRPTAASSSPHRWSWPSVPTRNRRPLAWGIATFAPGITATSFVLSLSGRPCSQTGWGRTAPCSPVSPQLRCSSWPPASNSPSPGWRLSRI
ncbi:MFS transporter [Rhodococcus sp. IEGM 1318]|uniref:MFS transporter n=1 Tax=Rhodococcus sp. IEGM 1318 TaxID=3082226 RepID=UPI0029534DAB|nr:MFS transporter [Rhodococcus sp. IEGM 1318]MDV8005779.1 MFS transporter [Rhodococcus sp. IEGM 1318]